MIALSPFFRRSRLTLRIVAASLPSQTGISSITLNGRFGSSRMNRSGISLRFGGTGF